MMFNNHSKRVRVEEVDWSTALPTLKLFRSFRMALHPPTLLIALLLFVVLWLIGQVFSGLLGGWVDPHEYQHYTKLSEPAFASWQGQQEQWIQDQLSQQLAGLETADPRVIDRIVQSEDRFQRAMDTIKDHYEKQHQRLLKLIGPRSDRAELVTLEQKLSKSRHQRDLRLEAVRQLMPRGVFEEAMRIKLRLFARLVVAGTELNFGLGHLLERFETDPDSVAGVLYELGFLFPNWLFHRHGWFLFFYMLAGMAAWALLGGAIARSAAVRATTDQLVTLKASLAFAGSKWGWFYLAPLLPGVLCLLIGLGLTLAGLVFFNLPVLDIAGGAMFGLALLCGAVITLILILHTAGLHLLYPAVAVEGTDAFDAVSRSFGYVLAKPWRWLFYSGLALLYGAVTYLFVAGTIYLTMLVTHKATGLWVFREAADGLNRFDAIWPSPGPDHFRYEVDWSQLSLWGKTAAALVRVWVYLLAGLLGAFVISFYFCANTWVYLLLRRASDGTALDDIYVEESPREAQVTAGPSAEPSPEHPTTAGPGHSPEGQPPTETPDPPPDAPPDASPDSHPDGPDEPPPPANP